LIFITERNSYIYNTFTNEIDSNAIKNPLKV